MVVVPEMQAEPTAPAGIRSESSPCLRELHGASGPKTHQYFRFCTVDVIEPMPHDTTVTAPNKQSLQSNDLRSSEASWSTFRCLAGGDWSASSAGTVLYRSETFNTSRGR